MWTIWLQWYSKRLFSKKDNQIKRCALKDHDLKRFHSGLKDPYIKDATETKKTTNKVSLATSVERKVTIPIIVDLPKDNWATSRKINELLVDGSLRR